MKRIDTIIRNQELIEVYARLICDHVKHDKAINYCSEEFGIKGSTIKSIISDNKNFYKKKHAIFNKCTIKIKKP